MTDFTGMRRLFMIPEGVAYLNTGTAGPCPASVFDIVVAWQRQLEGNPAAEYGRLHGETTGPAKAKLAGFVGTNPANLAFVTNVTHGMNALASGICGLQPGDEILSAADIEYGAVNNAWDCAAGRRGLTIRRIALPQELPNHDPIVQAFERAISQQTRVMYFSHVTFTALVMPVARLCRLARERGILTVVDGAHAPGLVPVALDALGCDYYVANCHKWLCAPKGTGFLYAAPAAQARLAALVPGWGWKQGQETFLGNFEHPGIYNPAPFIGVGAAVDFMNGLGFDNIMAHGRNLAGYGRSVLSQLPGVRPLTPAGADFCCSMVRYALPPLADPSRLQQALDRRNIVVPAGVTPAGGHLRVSTHLYNTAAEIDLLAQALAEAYGR
ncbi:MAG: aminotransferase class V-fold PLP-dependent enzyme [bacterium]